MEMEMRDGDEAGLAALHDVRLPEMVKGVAGLGQAERLPAGIVEIESSVTMG